tara:strand:+ start:81 stop:791 length:711 start_codon:yes stop_codon:yes gene_type:complete
MTTHFKRQCSPIYHPDPDIEKHMYDIAALEDTRYFIDRSYEVVTPFGYEPGMCKRQRKGKFFTDADLPATKKLIDDRKEEKRLKELRQCWADADEAQRWANLRAHWEKDKEKPNKPWNHNHDPEEDEPGVFHVSQTKNNGYDTYSDFVVVARSEGEARATHPRGGGDSFTYRKNELERNEEWRDLNNRGPAPAWFLGDGDSWCHGAVVKVHLISHYKPPMGEKPEYGILTASFRAG